MTMSSVVQIILEQAVEQCVRKGVKLDYEKYLPSDKTEFSAREVVNAISRALDEHGIQNNLHKPPSLKLQVKP